MQVKFYLLYSRFQRTTLEIQGVELFYDKFRNQGKQARTFRKKH